MEWPIRHADAFARLGIRPVRGVLLHGPPGCCKTTLARAAAHAAQATMISLRCFSQTVSFGDQLFLIVIFVSKQIVESTLR